MMPLECAFAFLAFALTREALEPLFILSASQQCRPLCAPPLLLLSYESLANGHPIAVECDELLGVWRGGRVIISSHGRRRQHASVGVQGNEGQLHALPVDGGHEY